MDYLERMVKWHPKDYLITGEPGFVLDRLEARLVREGYSSALINKANVVSRFYSKTTSLMSFLGITEDFVIKAIASPEGDNRTRLTVKANDKAKSEAERIIGGKFGVRPEG
jgi:hypothetical protein